MLFVGGQREGWRAERSLDVDTKSVGARGVDGEDERFRGRQMIG